MFENPRRQQARNFTTNVPKILDLKSSSEQIFSESWRWVPLKSSFAPEQINVIRVRLYKISGETVFGPVESAIIFPLCLLVIFSISLTAELYW